MCDVLEQLRNKSAEEILFECNQTSNIPIDLDPILDKYGIKRIPATFKELENNPRYKNSGEISGLILLSGNDVGIFYKKTDSIQSKRFIISHELGHCCLHTDNLTDGYIEFKDLMNSTDKTEQEASAFAEALLMPESQIRYISRRLIRPSLFGLAKIFDVPVSLMRKRLEYLGLVYYDDSIDKYIAME